MGPVTPRVEVEGLGFTYPSGAGRRRLQDVLSGRGARSTPTPVLREVGFAVEEGSCLGVIGRNGAGKSTLLRLLVGALRPDTGRVTVRGRIAPIIGLGSGLHPDYDAEENALLIGAAMGNRVAEMRERMDEIIAFAGLEEHRRRPVRQYSSGMLARLAFSVATCTRPDVLLVDEVLAVGDRDFNRKAQERMFALMSGTTATVLVSHDLGSVRALCDRVRWLDGGRVAAAGPPDEVVATYLEAVEPAAVEPAEPACERSAP